MWHNPKKMLQKILRTKSTTYDGKTIGGELTKVTKTKPKTSEDGVKPIYKKQHDVQSGRMKYHFWSKDGTNTEADCFKLIKCFSELLDSSTPENFREVWIYENLHGRRQNRLRP